MQKIMMNVDKLTSEENTIFRMQVEMKFLKPMRNICVLNDFFSTTSIMFILTYVTEWNSHRSLLRVVRGKIRTWLLSMVLWLPLILLIRCICTLTAAVSVQNKHEFSSIVYIRSIRLAYSMFDRNIGISCIEMSKTITYCYSEIS